MTTNASRLCRLSATFGCLLTATASGQLSGAYTIDPNGSGARNYKTFQEASIALAQQGVSGPVTLTVANGSYQGPWLIPSVTGTSATNKVTFRAATKWGATVLGDPVQRRSIEFVLATQSAPIEWIEFDGLRLTGTIYSLTHAARPYLRRIEVRNCEFPVNARFHAIYLNGLDHNVHHNRMHLDRSVLLNGERHEFHHNVVEGGQLMITGNGTDSRCRVFNNLLYGRRTNSFLIEAFGSVVGHNTFVGDSRQPVVELVGNTVWPIHFHGNIVVNWSTASQPGPLILDDSRTSSGIRSNGNLFFKTSTQGPMFQLVNTPYATIQAWRTATAQDLGSAVGQPKFEQVGVDYRLQQDSPAIDSAIGTPVFVVDDLDDQPRDAKPDIGCYERFQPFTVFGTGCPGYFGFVPKMGSSGVAALGSQNFAFTLRDGRGGAPAFFSFGISNTNWGGVPLPFRFGGTCDFLVSLDLVLLLSTSGSGPGNGTARLPVLIPNNPTIRGKHLYMQWAVVDAAAAPGLAVSDGGHLTFR